VGRPCCKGDKLYGRGGADDGYAAYASLTAIRALREAGGKHARCVVLIEACEESGSYDLPFYIDALKERIGTPSLVVCLDSAAATTTSCGARRRCAASSAATSASMC
jgi:acetylornithine deacetylase/succinyl-diaminopimelate desuccinylase-like protein